MARAADALDWKTILARAAQGERVVLRHAGKRLAVIPAKDLERLEDLEDDAEARAALAEFEASGEALIPAAEVHRRLGLPG